MPAAARIGETRPTSDHALALLAIGLTAAFGGGYLTCRLVSAYKSMYGAQLAVSLSTAAMRAIRLRWLYWAVPVLAVGYLWIRGFL